MKLEITVAFAAKLFAVSWFLAQEAVWVHEIREQGWKTWFQASFRQSYAQYLGSFTGREWARLGAWFLVMFHVLIVGACLLSRRSL